MLPFVEKTLPKGPDVTRDSWYDELKLALEEVGKELQEQDAVLIWGWLESAPVDKVFDFIGSLNDESQEAWLQLGPLIPKGLAMHLMEYMGCRMDKVAETITALEEKVREFERQVSK